MDVTSSAKEKPPYEACTNVPFNETEIIVETTSGLLDEAVEVDIYEEPEQRYYVEHIKEKAKVARMRKPNVFKRSKPMEKVVNLVSSASVDVIDIGTSLMIRTAEKTISESSIDKAIRGGNGVLGDISIEGLVEGMLAPSASDGRFAMLGTSVMWNVLKTEIGDLKNTITSRSPQSYADPHFENIDLNIANLSCFLKAYDVQGTGVFSNADLQYVFSLLTFRSTAKLLNKVKQFLKAYFIVACRPRCMIWRYTFRRTGGSHKKAIINLPSSVVQVILDILLDLTGIGNGDMPFHSLLQSTPFYQSLGKNEDGREERYYELCQLKDSLCTYFRDAITDVLNEIREMPFCLETGTMVTPLRGREKVSDLVMWKDYESYLRKEQDDPTEPNRKRRIRFEQRLCDVVAVARP